MTAFDYGLSPGIDEFEIIVFGPGYGEAIAVHSGGNNWHLVDSCIEPVSERSAHLAYLEAIGVGLASVRTITITHWHEDHIKGVASAVRDCPSAAVFASTALRNLDFARLMFAPNTAVKIKRTTSEILEVFDLLRARVGKKHPMPINFVGEFTTIYRDELTVISTLSPSAGAIYRDFAKLADQALHGDRSICPPPPTENEGSVVLWIEGPCGTALLGADLENTGAKWAGWKAILGSERLSSSKATYFKVAHHGAESAHHDDIWTRLLDAPDPVATITPFENGSNHLPTPTDRLRIGQATTNAHITSIKPPKPAKRDRESERILQDVKPKKIVALNSGFGAVRSRRRAGEVGWRIEHFGDAGAL